jgi:hypothetical protein
LGPPTEIIIDPCQMLPAVRISTDQIYIMEDNRISSSDSSLFRALPRPCAYGQTSGIIWPVQALARMR